MRQNASRLGRSTSGNCLIEGLEERLLMAVAKSQGGSGYSGTLSSNATLRQQQLICDPPEPLRGTTSVMFDPTKVRLIGAAPGPGYNNRLFNGAVEVVVTGERTILQPLGSYLSDPAGAATGYVQIRYALAGDAGQITPPKDFDILDEGGVDGIDTHSLMFALQPNTPDDAVIEYTVFAALAGEHSTNEEDFMIVNDGSGLRLGPADLSPATVSSAPADVFVAGSAWSGAFRDYVEKTGEGTAKLGYKIPREPAPPIVSWTNLNQIALQFEKPLSSDVEIDKERVKALDAKGNALPISKVTQSTDRLLLSLVMEKPLQGGVAKFELDLDKPAGVDRVIPVRVVPGDVSHSGGVNATDLVLTRNRVGRSTQNPGEGRSAYTIMGDVDGSGVVVAADLVLVRNRIGAVIIGPRTLVGVFGYRPITSALFSPPKSAEADAPGDWVA